MSGPNFRTNSHTFMFFRSRISQNMAPISRFSAATPSFLRHISASLPSIHLFSTSAFQSDKPEIVGNGARWVVIGEPSMKKDVYADRLSNLLQVPHISMRTLVQQHQRPSQIVSAGRKGKGVPDKVKFDLLTKRLEHGYTIGEPGFILTGVPRNKSQAEILDGIVDISLVINFKRLVKTSAQQSIHGVSWLDIVSLSKRQRQESRMRSSGFGGDSKDDKLRLYAEEGKEVELHYRRQQKLLNLQFTGRPEETWQGFIASLCLQHMDTFNSQSLAA